MAINVEIQKNPAENPLSVLRRFTKKVQSSGVLPRVRSIRYSERTQSHFKVKRARLNSIKRFEERNELLKLGKIKDEPKKGRRK